MQLRLAVEGKLIGFYRLDNEQKLLVTDELVEALRQETLKRLEAERQAEQERQRIAEFESLLTRYRERFGELPESKVGSQLFLVHLRELCLKLS